jgi:hypothetical protein
VRADLFSLAVVGYRLLTGRLPFTSLAQRTQPVVPPHVLDPGVPPSLSAVLARALSARPEERFPDAASLRAALQNAKAEPPPDTQLARLLARAATLVKDPYDLLCVPPTVDFAEVHRRAEAALRRLEAFRARPLPAEQQRELEALCKAVEGARRTLGSPLTRVGFDAVRGNIPGIARCLAAGVTEAAVEPLRRAFLEARPGAEERARQLFMQAHALEVQHALGPALERYAEALVLDPLNVPWQLHFQALRRRVFMVDGPAPARVAGAGASRSG